jgi:hypothetical protein
MIFMKMDNESKQKGANGEPGCHNATGTKAKIRNFFGYLMRKRKQQVKRIKNDVVLPSRIGYMNLQDECDNIKPDDVNKIGLDDMDNINAEATLGGIGYDGPVKVLQDIGQVKNITRLKVVKPKRKVVSNDATTCCNDCQTDGVAECVADFKTYDKQLESLPRRAIAKLRAKKTTRFVYSQLLNFLRCKHFMHVRDTHFITTLVSDARAWLLKNGYTMETSLDYTILTSAVQQAFIVSAEELEFRASIKNPRVVDHIKHHNATMEGNLGRVFMFADNSVKHAAARMARRPFTRSVTIGSPRPENLV